MAGYHPFTRRAEAAAAAAAAPPPPSSLDELNAVLDSPLASARHRVKEETLEQLHQHLYPGTRKKTLSDAQQVLEQVLQRQRKLREQPLVLKDGGEKMAIMVARHERYVSLLQENAQRQQAEEQRQRQHAPAPPRQHPPDGEQQADKSKMWLAAAISNQEEARTAGGQSPHGPAAAAAAPPPDLGLPGSRQVVPKPQQQLTGSRDYRDLGNVLPAARGARQPSKRRDRLLGVSGAGAAGAQQQQQHPAPRPGGKQQSLPEFLQQHPASPPTCGFCSKEAAPGRELKRVQVVEDRQVVLACFECIEFNGSSVQPLVDRRQDAGQEADPSNGRQQAAQQVRPQLALRLTDASGQVRQARLGAQFMAGGEQLLAPGAARGPSRGKGKQAAQARKRKGESDEEYDDAIERRQRQQRPGPGRRSGRYGLLQGDGSDSDSFGHMMRPRSAARRKQAANAEPVLIDILSDDDPVGGGEQQGDANAASATAGGLEEGPARRTRPARAAAYRSTAERFKGLKCLYPPGGGPGSVEVTHLDLPRLDRDEFLNDTVIDFYLRWLQDQLPPDVAKRCYFFNTFFFTKLTETSGGSLSEEVEAYAKQIEAKGEKLQTLRNHQKVKKWTKDVDLFAKDFIFVPVHEALHWSLMVVCHPGLVPDSVVVPLQRQAGEGAAGAGKGGEKASQENDAKPGQPTPCILHMDSIKGSHRMKHFTNKLRLYLEFEWDLKALQGPPDSVPARWAAAHPGQRRRWWNHDFPARSLKVPKQDNHCDCGLFMCSYPEFFTYRLPQAINLKEVSDLNASYMRTNRDLFEGTDHYYPGLLTERWFPDSNPTNLRYEMRRQILELMAEQQGLGVRRGDGTWDWKEGDPLADEVSKELLDLNARLAESPYMRPKEWEDIGELRKRERAAVLAKRQAERQAEEEERKAKRQQRQSAAAKRLAGDGVDPDLLAAAAERRIIGSTGGGPPPTLFAGINDVAAQASDDSQGGFEREHLPRGGRLPGAEQQQGAEAELQQAQDTPIDSSQPWDQGFAVDLSGDEDDEEGARGLPRSAAREIVQGFEPQLAAQGAAQQGQAAWQAVVEDCDADVEPARGAHPGSPPRSGAQQQAEGEEESPPRARRCGRTQRQRPQPAAGQPEEQPAVELSASPAEAAAAAGSGGGTDSPATTQDVGGSTGEETDGELDIVSNYPARTQQHKRRRTSGAPPCSPGAQDRSGRAVSVDWSQVALVAGVHWEAADGSRRHMDVRIWYKDKPAAPEQHGACPAADRSDYSIHIPFLAHTTAASLERLRAWQARHAEELGRLDSSRKEFHQIDELERLLAGQAAPEELAAQGEPAACEEQTAQAAAEQQQQPEGSTQRRGRQKRHWQAAEQAAAGEKEMQVGSQYSLDMATGLPLQGEHPVSKSGGAALAAAEEGMECLHLQQQQQHWTAAAKAAAAAAAAAVAADGPAVVWRRQQADVVDIMAEEDEQPAAARRHHASLLAGHPERQEAGPAAGGQHGSKQEQQLAHPQLQPLSRLPRKPSQPKHHVAAASGAALPPQQQRKPQLQQQQPQGVATAQFHRYLFAAPPAAAEPAVQGQPPAPFGGLPPGGRQPSAALKLMQNAGSDVLGHAKPHMVGQPGSAGDAAAGQATPGWQRRSKPSPPGSGWQQQPPAPGALPAGWEPGRPALVDPSMASPRLQSAEQQNSVKLAAAFYSDMAEEQASMKVQQLTGWPQQQAHRQTAPATLSAAAVRGASAGLQASAERIRMQREQAEQNKLLSRRQRKQQAEQEVINIESE